ncbi:MAG: bifunctional nuclease family protein [Firmicutes bacterium]|nr:bifunctional nuclease family protein [Bacillota bacterium]MDH7494409.1 bifunctional nuclease family protein [Bacillota bacterium]
MKVLSVIADESSSFSMLLTDADQRVILPIGIGPFEAQSIAIAVQGEEPPRPLTHDLLKTVCEDLGATVEKVVITDAREGVFFAEIHLYQDGKSLVLDSRPSDAVALAVRCGCPILMSPKLVEFTYKFEDIVAQE